MIMTKKLSDVLSVTYIADAAGFALYASSADEPSESKPRSHCSGACAAEWPPLRLDRFVLPSSFADADFSVFARSDGTLQTAYRGTPLYYFARDAMPGDTHGDAIDSFGLVTPALERITQ
jgi:predicted lipoprotein with Yx(FWY)xxD motif